jgi:AbrB family looped-hinge helix DNA binding protein
MATVTVSKKGWVVIPREIRERYRIRPGDKVHVLDFGGRIAIIPVPEDPIAAGQGLLKGGRSFQELLEEKRRELEEEEHDLPPPRPQP